MRQKMLLCIFIFSLSYFFMHLIKSICLRSVHTSFMLLFAAFGSNNFVSLHSPLSFLHRRRRRRCSYMSKHGAKPNRAQSRKNVHKTLSYWKIMLRKRESHKNCLRSTRMCFRLCSRERSMNVGAKQQQKIHKNAGVFTAVSSPPHTASKNFSTSHINMKGRKGERGRKCCERIKT